MYHTLIFADAHLRSRRGDEEWALTQIAEAAVAHGVARVIGAGDLIDRQQNRAAPIAAFFRFLDALEEHHIEFCYVQGQHDFDTPPWLSGHRNATHLHRRTVDLGDRLTAYGLDWQPGTVLQQQLAEIPDEANVLVAHQVWAEWMGDVAVPQGSFADIPGQVTTLVTGDLHQWRLELHDNAGGVEMRCLSPGATCAQAINEPHEHYYALVRDDAEIVRKKLKSRAMLDLPVLHVTEDLDRVAADLDAQLQYQSTVWASSGMPEALARPLVRVTYSHRLAETQQRLARILADRTHVVWKELPPEEQAAPPVHSVPAGQAVTPRSVLPDVLSPDDDPDAYALAVRLLEANNFKDEYARWKAEYLEATP